MRKKYSKILLFAATILLILFICFNSIWIIFGKNKIYAEDLIYLNQIKYNYEYNPEYTFSNLVYGYYSPIPKIISSIFFKNGNIPVKELFFLNIFMIIISICLISKVLEKIYDLNTALIFIIVFLSFPATTYFLRTLYDQIFLLFFFSLSFYFLTKSENFTNKKYSVLYGIVSGLFLLTRHTAAIYFFSHFIFIYAKNKKIITLNNIRTKYYYEILVISLYIIIQSLILMYGGKYKFGICSALMIIFLIVLINNLKNNQKLTNILVSLAITVVISFPWYFIRGVNIFNEYDLGTTPYLSTINFVYYLIVFITTHANIIISFLILIILFKKNKKDIYKWFYISALLIPYVILSLFPLKNFSVSFLTLMPISILTAIKFPNIKKISSKIMIIVFSFFIIYNSYPFENDNPTLKYGVSLELPFTLTF